MANDDNGRIKDGHQMLLRLAGRLPDENMTRCREQLAGGAAADMAREIVSFVLSDGVPLASEDVAVLTALLEEADDDTSVLTDVEVDDSDPLLWNFRSFVAEDATSTMDLERVVSRTLAAEADAIGCWRAWRIWPEDEMPETAKAVFVVEVSADADAVGVTARLQEQLAAAGEDSPQVEVWCRNAELPTYQRLARGSGELIWAAAEDPGMQLARVFDEVDPEDGPSFSPDHPRLPEDEADRVAQYLRAGEPVLVTSARMDDVVDAAQRYCVPLNFRTDGLWVWTEASAYYAEQYNLQPDPGLLAHIRSKDYQVPDVDGVELHRALAVLQKPPETESVWTFGSGPEQ